MAVSSSLRQSSATLSFQLVRQCWWASALNIKHCLGFREGKANYTKVIMLNNPSSSQGPARLTLKYSRSKRAERQILFRVSSLLTPHRFPLDKKEGNHCAKNHQRYENSCNRSSSYFGAFATTIATVNAIASTWWTTVTATRTSGRRWPQRRRGVWWRSCCRAVAKGVPTCPTVENLNYCIHPIIAGALQTDKSSKTTYCKLLMLFSLSGIHPLNWLFATLLQVAVIIGSQEKQAWILAGGKCINLQVRQREIREDIYRTSKLVVMQVTDKRACCHYNSKNLFYLFEQRIHNDGLKKSVLTAWSKLSKSWSFLEERQKTCCMRGPYNN